MNVKQKKLSIYFFYKITFKILFQYY